MPVLAPRNQRIDAFCRFRSVSLVLFHCRRPCPASSGVNGNEKFIILCVLCLPRSSRRWYWGVSSKAPQGGTSPALRDRLGGEYKLTYLHSKAGTFSLAEGLMDQLRIIKILINFLARFRYYFHCLNIM
jgi:hypothetical protein